MGLAGPLGQGGRTPVNACLENGLLHVDLEREIPEAMKPRAIPIASSGKVLEVQPTKAAA
jgi:molecular chaperone IbpA